MMKQAVRWGYASHNPVDEVDTQTEEKPGDRYLHPTELKELLDRCEDRLWPMVLFAASTGLRQGEIIALRRADIDSEGRTVTVRSGISKTSEERRVPLNQDALNALAACSDGDPVFGWDRFPSKLWAGAIKKLGWRGKHVDSRLQYWRFHDLRHHCASHLVMKDVPIQKVARILGHRNLTTTMRYAHLSDESLIDAMDKIAVGNTWENEKVTSISSARKPA